MRTIFGPSADQKDVEDAMGSMTIDVSGRSVQGTTASDLPCRPATERALRRAFTPAGLATVVVCSALAAGAVAAGRGPAAIPATTTAAFDGHYGGALVAAFEGRTGACARRAATADLVVRNGRALVSIGDYGPALHGPVRADGSAMLKGAADTLVTTAGRFEDGRFVGELRGWGCAYALDLDARR